MNKYTYLEKQEINKELREKCENILLELQKEVKEYFTFDFKLIGSGEKRLITVNLSDKCSDIKMSNI